MTSAFHRSLIFLLPYLHVCIALLLNTFSIFSPKSISPSYCWHSPYKVYKNPPPLLKTITYFSPIHFFSFLLLHYKIHPPLTKFPFTLSLNKAMSSANSYATTAQPFPFTLAFIHPSINILNSHDIAHPCYNHSYWKTSTLTLVSQ